MDFKIRYKNGLGEVECLDTEVFKAAYDNTAWSLSDIEELNCYNKVYRSFSDAVDHISKVCNLRNYTFQVYDDWGNIVA